MPKKTVQIAAKGAILKNSAHQPLDEAWIAQAKRRMTVAPSTSDNPGSVQSRSMTNTAKEFVKLTEVKEIVQDMVVPLLNQMKIREQEAIDFKNHVVIIKDEQKKQRADVRQALLLRNTVNEHHKSLKSISKKQEV